MQQYDIATKVLIESCRDEIIERFVGIRVKESTLVQMLPQETVSVKRSDFPVLVTDDKGITRLVILEIQTVWHRRVPLNLLDYRTRYLLNHDVEAISCVILLRPSSSATDCYEDNELRFKYRLVKIYEMDGRETVAEGTLCLLPFVPLMKYGTDVVDNADMRIYESELPRAKKADMLTSMAILSGLVSDSMPEGLISRRKDIMIESAAYDIIKKDGMQQGMQQGLSEGLLAILEVKFGLDGLRIYSKFKDIKDTAKLKSIIEATKLAESPEDVLSVAEME